MCLSLDFFFKIFLEAKCFRHDLKSKFSIKAKKKFVPVDEARCFITELFKNVGIEERNCKTMAEVVIAADKKQKFVHGVISLPRYLEAIEKQEIDIQGQPKIIMDSPVAALVSGENALGPVVGKFCMLEAMKKAKKSGAGLVCARLSNYFGMASFYSQMAIERGLIGIAMSNAPPALQKSVLGSNPLAFASQNQIVNYISLDIASMKVCKQDIEWKSQSCQKAPADAAFNVKVKDQEHPGQAFQDKCLCFDGLQGCGSACLVEILCGLMSGANYSTKFRNRVPGSPINIGHCFIAVDPSQLYTLSQKTADFHLKHILSLHQMFPVYEPADLSEYLKMNVSLMDIPYNRIQVGILRALSSKYGIATLQGYVS